MSIDRHERVRRGMVDAWSRQVGMVDDGKIYRTDGLVVALTMLPDPTMNVTLAESEPEDPDAAVDTACSLFELWGHEIGFDLEQGAHPSLEQALAKAGLQPLITRPAMVIDLTDLSRLIPPPESIRVERVESPEQLDIRRLIDTEVFSVASSIADRALPEDALWTAGFDSYVAAFPGGEPGAAISTHTMGQTVGIMGVGTLPAHRRSGLARAATLHVLDVAARSGASMAWLQSSDMAVALYESIGFTHLGNWTVWTRPA